MDPQHRRDTNIGRRWHRRRDGSKLVAVDNSETDNGGSIYTSDRFGATLDAADGGGKSLLDCGGFIG